MTTLAQPSLHPGASGLPAEQIWLSLNETESLCLKAARGAGYSWGLAEEVGFAASKLASIGIDATAPILALLLDKQGTPTSSGAPRPVSGHWQSMDQQPLCPIRLGAAMVDSALISDGPFNREMRLDPVAAPILLLPFLARAAQIRRQALEVDWPDGQLVIDQDDGFDRTAARSWLGETALAITVRTASTTTGFTRAPVGLPVISTAILEGLNALALRTTVPANETSRRGAGSSTTDND